MRRGAVHADLSVSIHGHETESRVRKTVQDFDIQIVIVGDRLPITKTCAAKSVGPDAEPGSFYCRHVEDVSQVGNIGSNIIIFMNLGCFEGSCIGNSFDITIAICKIFICLVGDSLGDLAIGWSCTGRVVLYSSVIRWIVGWSDYDARPPGQACGLCYMRELRGKWQGWEYNSFPGKSSFRRRWLPALQAPK